MTKFQELQLIQSLRKITQLLIKYGEIAKKECIPINNMKIPIMELSEVNDNILDVLKEIYQTELRVIHGEN